MRFLIELSMEHPTIPRSEALAASHGAETFSDDGVVVLDSDASAETLASRLGMSHAIDAYAFSEDGDPESLIARFRQVEPLLGETWAVRVRAKGERWARYDSAALEKRLGASIKRAGVNLRTPKTEVRVVLSGRIHVGIKLEEIDRAPFDARKVQHRPFFSPISLHPRLARAFVNLAAPRAGERLLDPFCGTGGILLEAALCGLHVIGGDIDGSKVEGTKAVLHHYVGPSAYEFHVGDVGDIGKHVSDVDCVVTDPPYGRAATTTGEEVRSLYKRALETARGLLRDGGRLVIAFPDPRHADLAAGLFTLRERHAIFVHRSLTRHVHVFEKA
ncbi:MAG: methyltransferase domain-containing protein [Euryarchaeota archaeon]|nr:methyltransferase domain-containing protein [Euryarchaeota archaeon]